MVGIDGGVLADEIARCMAVFGAPDQSAIESRVTVSKNAFIFSESLIAHRINWQREMMVGSRAEWLGAPSKKMTPVGGDSSVLNSELAA